MSLELLDFDDSDLAPDGVGPGWHYRDYQVKSFAAIEAGWAQYRTQLIVQATGTGKTVIFTKLAKDEVNRGGKVLILAHTEELLDQASDKLLASTGLLAAKEKAANHATIHDPVVVASVQTLSKDSRLAGWSPNHFTLVIVDEAHRSLAASYVKILKHFAPARVLGVTATADRGDKRNLGQIYENVAAQFDLRQACLEGWLVRPHAKTIPIEIDLKGIKAKRTSEGSDYDLGEVSHRIAPFLQQIAAEMVKETKGRGQGVVFLPSIETARMMANSLKEQGIAAEFVSGACQDRTQKVADFMRGHTRVLCNAMLLIEGFDHDAVDWICVLRPTKIRALYVQAVGRGTRPLGEVVAAINAAASAAERCEIIRLSRKPNLLILDFLWLTEKLDLITPSTLVPRSDDVAQKMKEAGPVNGDLLDIEADAARDLLASLEKAVNKNKRRKARIIDPLRYAVTIKDPDLETYEPSSAWEFRPASPEQLKKLEQFGIDPKGVQNSGQASKLLDTLIRRSQMGLCSIGQMTFLESLGVPDAALLSHHAASEIIGKRLARFKRARYQKPSTLKLHG